MVKTKPREAKRTMKAKKDKNYYLQRAKEDFKSLVIYFNITRPVRENGYKTNGKFDLKKATSQMKFLKEWKNQTRGYKAQMKNVYARYSSTFNYTFGIPCDLINDVLGEYKDDTGKRFRITLKDILPSFPDLEIVNDGRKIDMTTHKVVAYWTRKFLIKDEKKWYGMISNEKYHDVFKFASKRLQKILERHGYLKENAKKTNATSNSIVPKTPTQTNSNNSSFDIKSICHKLIEGWKEGYVQNDVFFLILECVFGVKTVRDFQIQEWKNHQEIIKDDSKKYDREANEIWKTLKRMNIQSKGLKDIIEDWYTKTL